MEGTQSLKVLLASNISMLKELFPMVPLQRFRALRWCQFLVWLAYVIQLLFCLFGVHTYLHFNLHFNLRFLFLHVMLNLTHQFTYTKNFACILYILSEGKIYACLSFPGSLYRALFSVCTLALTLSRVVLWMYSFVFKTDIEPQH